MPDAQLDIDAHDRDIREALNWGELRESCAARDHARTTLVLHEIREGAPREEYDEAVAYAFQHGFRLLPWGGFTPRAWQTEALPIALDAIAEGKRGIIRAIMGAGKSILQAEVLAQLVAQLEPHQRIVVTAPSQNLVDQLSATLERRLPGMVGRFFQYAKEVDRPIIVACHASLYKGDIVCPDCHDYPESAHEREIEGGELDRVRAEWLAAAMATQAARDAASVEFCESTGDHERAVALSYRGKLAHALIEAELEVVLWMADEAHKTQCTQCLGFGEWVDPKGIIGFTATPFRANDDDRLELFDELLYDYGPQQAIADGVIVPPIIIPYAGEEIEELDDVALKMITDHLEAHPGTPGLVNAQDCEDAGVFADKLTAAGVRARPLHSKLSAEANAESLLMLELGELDALVHVNMLAEGVDFPWLRWLCLRRSSKDRTVSRTRFCQEVGRAVRAHPGKSNAYILDPLDLFNKHSLDYDAVLGAMLSDEDEGPQAELDRLIKEVWKLFAEESIDADEDDPGLRDKRYARALDPAVAWVRQAALCYRLKNIVAGELRTSNPAARAEQMSAGQGRYIASLTRSAGRYAEQLDPEERVALRVLCMQARWENLTFGDASDLITVLNALKAQQHLPRIVEEVEHAA